MAPVNSTALPTRLNKEPLLDVLFEIRFTSQHPVSNILPGILFSRFPHCRMEQLPQSQLPQILRQQSPELKYAPLVRLVGEQYAYQVGDNSFSISSLMPYKGWQHFKNEILESIEILKIASLVDTVERFSLKYIDLIEHSGPEKSEILNVALQIGERDFATSNYQVHTELSHEDMTALIQIISSAKVQTPNAPDRHGIVVDIDTIFQAGGESLAGLSDLFANKLDRVHALNKDVFFSTLSSRAIELLEPIYD